MVGLRRRPSFFFPIEIRCVSQFQLPVLNDESPPDVAAWPDQRKASIQQAFARAAGNYDQHADVQRQVAEMLAQRLPNSVPRQVLELGCGTGLYTQLLCERFPAAELTAVDFCGAMLEQARNKLADNAGIRWQLADIENQELYREEQQRYELVTSSGTLQWLTNVNALFARTRRVLRSGGELVFASFGPQTYC